MSKTKQKRPELAGYDIEGRLRMIADGLSETFEALRGGGEHPSAIADIARIATSLTATLGELRQNAKAVRRELALVPHDELVAYLRGLPEDERRDLCREVLGSDDMEPVL